MATMNDARFRPTAGHIFTTQELGEYQREAQYNAIPAGLCGAYDGPEPPRGWLWCRGAFDVTLFPRLARVYPDGQLPDRPGQIIKF